MKDNLTIQLNSNSGTLGASQCAQFSAQLSLTPRVKRTQSNQYPMAAWKEIKFTSNDIKCRYHHSSVLYIPEEEILCPKNQPQQVNLEKQQKLKKTDRDYEREKDHNRSNMNVNTIRSRSRNAQTHLKNGMKSLQVKNQNSSIDCQPKLQSKIIKSTPKLLVYGGFDNNYGILSDLKMYNLCQLQQNPTCSKNDNVNESSCCSLGSNGSSSWPAKWVTLSSENGPGTRHSHSAVLHKNIMYIFGGKVDRFASTNTLHAYCIENDRWEKIETYGCDEDKNEKLKKHTANKQTIHKPGNIDSHQAVVYQDSMYVFGGFMNNQFSNKIYSLDLNTRIWTRIHPKINQYTLLENRQDKNAQEPQPRSDFSMVVHKDKIYIYAGKNLNCTFSDLWQFCLIDHKFKKLLSSPSHLQPRSGHSTIISGPYLVTFGGISSVTHERDDLICYNLDNNTWTTIWKNSQQIKQNQKNQKKSKIKKLSNSNASPNGKKIDGFQFKGKSKGKQDQHQEDHNKIRKYRRPIAQQKILMYKKQQKGQKERNKKQNERRYMLISQIETAIKPYQNINTEHYSPLIQSLTNSIMMTSSLPNNQKPQGHNNSQSNGYSGPFFPYSTRQQLCYTNSSNSNRCKDSPLSSIKEKDRQQCLAQSQFQYQRDNLKQSNYNTGEPLSIAPKKINARDGHSTHLYKEYMIIFGGDRHMIANNDIVLVNLASLLAPLAIKQSNGSQNKSNKQNQFIQQS